MKRAVSMFIGVLFLAVFAAGAVADVEIVLPFDGAVTGVSDMLVLYRTPAGMKPVLTLDGVKVADVKVVGGNETDLHHVRLTLKEGANKLAFADGETEKREMEITLFYIPPQSMKRAKGAKASKFAFHGKEFEKRCGECHAMPDEMETVKGKPMTPAGKICSSCHPDIGKAQKPHVPTATYDCFRCHEPDYRPERFYIRSSQVALCGDCHDNFLERIMGQSKFVHGPVATGSCVVCHDPHGGEVKGLLQEPVEMLCLRCHGDTVATGVDKAIHGETPCTSCHSPHGSEAPEMTLKKVPDLCLSCHADPMKKLEGHPIQGHPVSADVDPSKPGRAMGCLSCHNVHSKPDVSRLNIIEDTERQRKFCLRCHYSG